MNTLETLFFPDTALLSDRQFPLFLLFSPVHLIQAVEPDGHPDRQPMDTFMDEQFCQAYTPHPLRHDRDRFLYLINDLKNRKDDYAAQLSHITLASMSKKKADGDSSRSEIISSLLGHDVAEEVAQQNAEELWQARLILKIAEILDREEEEVAKALVELEQSEVDLFAELQGKDDNHEEEDLYRELTDIKAKMARPRTESMKNRLRAWCRMIDNSDIPNCPIWSTGREEIADILFEHHEKKHGSPPDMYAELDLPARIGKEIRQEKEKLLLFRTAAQSTCEELCSIVTRPRRDLQNDAIFKTVSSTWRKLVDDHYPQSSFGRTPIRFYLFEEPLPVYAGLEFVQIKNGSSILAVFAP